jgi:hypothetical protein
MNTVQPAKCPVCGGGGIPIAYGFPGDGLIEAFERGEVEPGGCVITRSDPDRRCRSCGYEWRTTNPQSSLNKQKVT